MTLMPEREHEHFFVCSNLTESRCIECHKTPEELRNEIQGITRPARCQCGHTMEFHKAENQFRCDFPDCKVCRGWLWNKRYGALPVARKVDE